MKVNMKLIARWRWRAKFYLNADPLALNSSERSSYGNNGTLYDWRSRSRRWRSSRIYSRKLHVWCRWCIRAHLRQGSQNALTARRSWTAANGIISYRNVNGNDDRIYRICFSEHFKSHFTVSHFHESYLWVILF